MHGIKWNYIVEMAVTTCFTFSIEAMVRGYHVYQSVLEAVNGEVLECSREIGNCSDSYAVAVTKSSGETEGTVTVGHVPRKISICFIFIRRGGVIDCTVTGRRCYSADLAQRGLEIPCILTFKTSSSTDNRKAEDLLRSALYVITRSSEINEPLTKEPGVSIIANEPLLKEEPGVSIVANEPLLKEEAGASIVANEPLLKEEAGVSIVANEPLLKEEAGVSIVANEPLI